MQCFAALLELLEIRPDEPLPTGSTVQRPSNRHPRNVGHVVQSKPHVVIVGSKPSPCPVVCKQYRSQKYSWQHEQLGHCKEPSLCSDELLVERCKGPYSLKLPSEDTRISGV